MPAFQCLWLVKAEQDLTKKLILIYALYLVCDVLSALLPEAGALNCSPYYLSSDTACIKSFEFENMRINSNNIFHLHTWLTVENLMSISWLSFTHTAEMLKRNNCQHREIHDSAMPTISLVSTSLQEGRHIKMQPRRNCRYFILSRWLMPRKRFNCTAMRYIDSWWQSWHGCYIW